MPVLVSGQLMGVRSFKTRDGEQRYTADIAEMGATHQVSMSPEQASPLRQAVGQFVQVGVRLLALARDNRAFIIMNATTAPQIQAQGR